MNSILNDIFGARMILSSKEIAQVMEKLDDWQELYGLKTGIYVIKMAMSVFISILKIKVILLSMGTPTLG